MSYWPDMLHRSFLVHKLNVVFRWSVWMWIVLIMLLSVCEKQTTFLFLANHFRVNMPSVSQLTLNAFNSLIRVVFGNRLVYTGCTGCFWFTKKQLIRVIHNSFGLHWSKWVFGSLKNVKNAIGISVNVLYNIIKLYLI